MSLSRLIAWPSHIRPVTIRENMTIELSSMLTQEKIEREDSILRVQMKQYTREEIHAMCESLQSV